MDVEVVFKLLLFDFCCDLILVQHLHDVINFDRVDEKMMHLSLHVLVGYRKLIQVMHLQKIVN
jgi:hypothetical protein